MPRRPPARLRSSLPKPDQRSVLINAPFDPAYADLFIALVAGLTCFGRKPRCVLEVGTEEGNRLERFYGLIPRCGASIHDLSRVQLSGARNVPRFNMPFELGVAYCLSRHHGHRFFVFEEVAGRLEASLSDVKGYDVLIHHGTAEGVLSRILDAFATPARAPKLAVLLAVHADLARTVQELQHDLGAADPFSPHVFRQMVAAAAAIAKARGPIR